MDVLEKATQALDRTDAAFRELDRLIDEWAQELALPKPLVFFVPSDASLQVVPLTVPEGVVIPVTGNHALLHSGDTARCEKRKSPHQKRVRSEESPLSGSPACTRGK